MKEGITVNEHKSVGPYANMYGHGPVIVIQRHNNRHIDEQLLVGSRLYKGDYKFTEMLLYIVATMVWVHSVEDT